MRRHVAPAFVDFDYRANTLRLPIEESWEESVKAQHRAAREAIAKGLAEEFGSAYIDKKIENFVAIGASPASIIAHHNVLLRQVRGAFVAGNYYPALTGACALGERILNHLIIDLRDDYTTTPEYKKVHGKGSFDDWGKAIAVLTAWGVLQPNAAKAFADLEALRHRSLHFNADTVTRLRDEALRAIGYLSTIVEQQFSAFGSRPWFIEGTPGVCFIKKEWECAPFIRRYYLPICPKVGYLYSWETAGGGWQAVDYERYEGEREVTDEEFRDLYNSRDPEQCASRSKREQAGEAGNGKEEEPSR